ncbi:MAG: hypothetical protein AAF587_32960 [Bacteroidota bacterium]
MTKYKIHIDKPLPDSTRIAQHKDFDSLYQQYQVHTRFEFWRNLYRKPRYFAAVVGIVAILFLVVEVPQESSLPPLIEAPIESIKLPFVQKEIQSDAQTRMKIGENWELVIPPEAFMDPESEAIVAGPIQLEVREFHDPADLFIAGISMNDDSMAHMEGLESLTLLEVQARQDGKLIALRKSLEAVYYTGDTSTGFDVFQLDTVSRSWLNQGKDQLQLVVLPPDSSHILPRPTRPELLAMIDLEENDQMIPRAAKPIPQKPGKPFGVKVRNLKDYPEFRGFEKVYWEYVEMTESVNPWTEGLIGEGKGWEDVRIKRMPTRPDGFELKFAKQTEEGDLMFRTVIAKPMFEARTQEEADRIYQERYRAYQKAVQERLQAAEEQRELEMQILHAKNAYADSLSKWEASTLDSVFACYRRFSFDRLGVIGLSRKRNFSDSLIGATLSYEEERMTSRADQRFFLILPGENTMIRLSVEEGQVMLPNHLQGHLLTIDPESGDLLLGSFSPSHTSSEEEPLIELMPVEATEDEEQLRQTLKGLMIRMEENTLFEAM